MVMAGRKVNAVRIVTELGISVKMMMMTMVTYLKIQEQKNKEYIKVETTIKEQRKDKRTDLAWPVSVWLPNAFRFYIGRSINVSGGGAYISVPTTAPVGVGDQIEINFPRSAMLAKRKGQFARIRSGKVLRVKREALLKEPATYIAVQFNE